MIAILTLFRRFGLFSKAFWRLSEYNYPKVLRTYHSVFWTFLKRFEYFRTLPTTSEDNRELKQPRRRRQQKPYKFAYSIFARFARAFFIFWHFEDVLVLSTTRNDLFCSCVDYVSIWCQMFNFVLFCPKRWFQINSRTVRRHSSSIMTLTNWKMIAETRSFIFRWRSRFRQRRVCLSSLLSLSC